MRRIEGRTGSLYRLLCFVEPGFLEAKAGNT